jgi:hypothetical protein
MTLFAQQEEVISSSGGFFENNTGSISFILGECIITKYLIIDFTDIKDLSINIAAYPNPVKEFITLKVENPRGFYYVLYDINGVILEQKEIVNKESEISFENLIPSVYVIKLFQGSTEIRTFKIIKQ